MNRLSKEQSPYLLQHAGNPVDWRPWGEDAFNQAQAEQKPIFLSIGYSTCHWCHVMARESFEDEEVAAILNRSFIPVKVDREERPDVDAVYMEACVKLTGSGGWPLTVVATPGGRPFFAGTYFPKHSRYGSTGLIELLKKIDLLWKADRERLMEAGDEITEYLRRLEERPTRGEPGRGLLGRAAALLHESYDGKWGGFGTSPKFPMPHMLLFLLRYSAAANDPEARRMALNTLSAMYRGGIFDHIGGGFSRYSTDEKWLIPHFEKMLYDNALLSYVYAEAFAVSGRPLYRTAAVRTIEFAIKELSDGVSFYSAQDADSGGTEGGYYVLTPGETRSVLKEGADLFNSWFDITDKGNFEGKSVPNLISNPRFEEENAAIERMIPKVYEYRRARARIMTDDKILTSWNALMISALSKAARTLEEPRYVSAAVRAERFIEERLTQNGRLLARFRAGQSAGEGGLDDYAFYACALLELYAATFDVGYLSKAANISDMMIKLFGSQSGGFYLNAGGGLIFSPKSVRDGALPSGNSAAAWALTRLWRLTGEARWQKACEAQLSFMAGCAADYPAEYCAALTAMAEKLYDAGELICALSNEAGLSALQPFLRSAPGGLAVIVKTAENADALEAIAPKTAIYPIGLTSKYYYCQGGVCREPMSSLEELSTLIKDMR